MTAIEMVPESVQKFTEELTKAQASLESVIEGLDKSVKAVEPKWSGDSQQAFLRFYREWRKGIEMHSSALKKTAEQLQKMSEDYKKIN
ncbi:MAG TPA: WXG100 family type VII secretion target [Anaerolineales bacterium]